MSTAVYDLYRVSVNSLQCAVCAIQPVSGHVHMSTKWFHSSANVRFTTSRHPTWYDTWQQYHVTTYSMHCVELKWEILSSNQSCLQNLTINHAINWHKLLAVNKISIVKFWTKTKIDNNRVINNVLYSRYLNKHVIIDNYFLPRTWLDKTNTYALLVII